MGECVPLPAVVAALNDTDTLAEVATLVLSVAAVVAVTDAVDAATSDVVCTTHQHWI